MTRGEIRERAVQIGDDVEITSTHEEWNATVEMHIAKIVRATLEEAARAVCPWCRSGEYKEPDADLWWHDPYGNGPSASIECDASEIHDLIRELDKEGDHE